MMKPMTDTGVELGKWLGGAAAGALLMYMLDPDRGGARRAQSGQRIAGIGRHTTDALSSTLHGLGDRLGHRADGAIDSARTLVSDAGEAAEQLPSAIKPDGLARSIGQSVSTIGHNATEAVSRAAGSLLQGVRGGGQWSTMLEAGQWAPAMRSSALVGGGMLGLMGLMRRSPLGLVIGLAGMALLARGATNQPLRNMLRKPALDQTIDVEKSIHIDASPERVYEMWSNYENFPLFMSHVIEVRDLGGRRSHWVVKGPAGTRFEWDAVLTEQSYPHRIAWRSEPGSEVSTSGSVQFQPERGGTRVTVRMSYTPPAGVVGHGIARLLGADPEHQMNEDLARMRAIIERGMLPPEKAQKSRFSSRFLH